MAVSQATIGLARGEIQSALVQDKSYKSNVTNRPLKDLFKKKICKKTQKKVMSELVRVIYVAAKVKLVSTNQKHSE